MKSVANEPPDRWLSAYYGATVEAFLSEDPVYITGKLAKSHGHDVELEQLRAWEEEIKILPPALKDTAGTIYLEFDVPRLASRIDAVLIVGPAILAIEFKVGEKLYRTAHYNQIWDYALDLKNFHLASHNAPIFPLLVATEAAHSDADWQGPDSDQVHPPRRCTSDGIATAVRDAISVAKGLALDAAEWGKSPYHPTPTIIEAARSLYFRHSVEAISRHDAGATNLSVTSTAVENIIEGVQRERRKAIIFVTGVPGAGKTLVGLNVATRRRDFGESRAVFLSGNGPLVAVLQEALVRDELVRTKRRVRKGVVRLPIKAFIQNVHHFRDEGMRRPDPPYDHVVIFDEAQRAWNRDKTADFMKRRKRVPNFNSSEPEFLISYLDRHPDWAVVICLVGGGQEIHTGEAGIGEWLEALRLRFPHWLAYVSPNLAESEYAAGTSVKALGAQNNFTFDARLHLATAMRSFRSEKVSAFVKAVLDCEVEPARNLLREVSKQYPIAITRDLQSAKQWVRGQARGSERYGLVASSQAQRLKPHAIDIRVEIDPVHWFLDDRKDTRSSFYLEDAATEFQIQGLELDWICLTWDADLRMDGQAWRHHAFRGDGWTTIHKADRKRYQLNAYRVLLTRARQGMVIFVPPGDAHDPTRDPRFYDETYSYLAGIGLQTI
jgi:Schlafen group 3, DNA/RNA helicase domain